MNVDFYFLISKKNIFSPSRRVVFTVSSLSDIPKKGSNFENRKEICWYRSTQVSFDGMFFTLYLRVRAKHMYLLVFFEK